MLFQMIPTKLIISIKLHHVLIQIINTFTLRDKHSNSELQSKRENYYLVNEQHFILLINTIRTPLEDFSLLGDKINIPLIKAVLYFVLLNLH